MKTIDEYWGSRLWTICKKGELDMLEKVPSREKMKELNGKNAVY